MQHGTGLPVYPANEKILDIWRVGIVAYRAVYLKVRSDYPAFVAGRAAVMEAYPDLSEADAGRAVSEGVGWITRTEHVDWFWGIGIDRDA